MPTDLADRVCECLRAASDKRLKARDIAEWIAEHHPEEARERKAKDGSDLGPAELIARLTSEIGLGQARWRKAHPELRATDDKPRRYYWQADDKAEVSPTGGGGPPEAGRTGPVGASETDPLRQLHSELQPAAEGEDLSAAKPTSRRLFMLDRAAVLFIGILVGSAIGLAFHTNGKPFASLFGADEVSAETPPVVTPPAQACTDAFPLSPRVISALRADRPIQIGVFGDSFGDGLWAGTVQHLHGRPDFKVFQFSKESTGFTRYASLDLLDDAHKKIDAQPIDIALINFGTNDTQGVFADGRAAPYMSTAWRQVIGNRATALVKLFQDRGIAVGWVGLPRMRDDKFDRQIQLMNGFYAGLMCHLHVPFVNPVAVSEDAGHHFATELTDVETGRSYLARADDGIHMTVHGYRMLALPLLKRIDSLAPPRQTVAAK